MTVFPLLHILFFIAASFAPHGATQITVTGPDQVSHWVSTPNGWDKDKVVWSISGTTIVTRAAGKMPQSVDVSQFVSTVVTHDWQKEKIVTLAPGETLEKTNGGFILRLYFGRPSEKVYRITYGPKG